YGLDDGPNFADPHHGTGVPDKNILFIKDYASLVGSTRITDKNLEAMQTKLKRIRDVRKQPLLDTKILTSWNALMIRALAYGGEVLQEPRYLDAAAAAADFLLKHHRDRDGNLFRTSRPDTVKSPADIVAKYNGFLDDYAFFAQALLALHEAAGDTKWRDAAGSIVTSMRMKFEDAADGGFFFTDA